MIPKPIEGDYAPYYHNYISLVIDSQNILSELQKQHMDTIDLVTSLDDNTLQSSYAPGKWTIMEILLHLMDAERIFAYRALRFARKDKTELAGFDENLYAPNSKANSKKILNVVKEFSLLRASTIELFAGFDEEMLAQTGTANGNHIRVNALPFIICGHEIHHMKVIEDRYIGK